MVKIVVLASFNMDLVMRAERLPAPGETLQGQFTMYLGGKGFNQAVAARRLGADVAVIGRVGDDDFGAAFLDALDAEGIDRRGVTVDPAEGTGVAAVVVEAAGENTIIQAPQANRALTGDDVGRSGDAFSGASVALAQFETSMQGLREFCALARHAGATVILNPAPAAAVEPDVLVAADLIVPNELEAAALVGGPMSVRAIDNAAALRERIDRDVVLTMGARGAVVVTGEMRIEVPAFSVDVVDTVGAGDAFCGALAVRLAEGAGIGDAVRFAAAAGALACTRPGAEPSMPRRQDVEALLATGVAVR